VDNFVDQFTTPCVSPLPERLFYTLQKKDAPLNLSLKSTSSNKPLADQEVPGNNTAQTQQRCA
jgi:hypothetical protein